MDTEKYYTQSNIELRAGEIYFSEVTDSTAAGSGWSRIIVDAIIKTRLNIGVYASDEENKLGAAGSTPDVKGVFCSVVPPADILISKATGRYMRFSIQSDMDVRIKNIRLYYLREEFIRYLPEVYRSNDFLRRYLSLFQNIYLDIEHKIDNIADNFDPDLASLDFLEWIAKWVDIKYTSLWGEEKLRKLVGKSYSLHKKQGTREGITEIVELFTGKKPVIIEPHEAEEYDCEPRLRQDAYSFIMLMHEDAVPDEEHYKSLVRIVNDFKPAHTDMTLIVLKPYISLGSYHFLGVNSHIAERGLQHSRTVE